MTQQEKSTHNNPIETNYIRGGRFLISVCMATYNGAKYLREQIDSILNQDLSAYPNAELELIVSDDGSTDSTLDILASYNDYRIKIYHHTNKKTYRYNKAAFACTANFANALEKATGNYIFLSDQDDIWFPLKISRTLDVLTVRGGVCAVAFDVVTPELKKLGPVIYHKEPRWKIKRKLKFYGFSCGFTRKELNSILPMPDIPYHDNFITYISAFKNNSTVINEILALHRWSGVHNVSASVNDSPFIIKNWYRMKIITIAFFRFLESRL